MTQFVGGPPEPASSPPSGPRPAPSQPGGPASASPWPGSPASASPWLSPPTFAGGYPAYGATAAAFAPPATLPSKARYPVIGLWLAGAAVVGIAGTSYALLATIRLSAFQPFQATAWWILGFFVASSVGLAGLIIGIVALAKGRRRILASVTLGLMIVAAPLALFVGFSAGTASLYAHTVDKLAALTDSASQSLSQTLKDQGVEINPLLEWFLD